MPIPMPRLPVLPALCAALLALCACASPAPERTAWLEAQAHELVDQATASLADFGGDDEVPGLRAALRESCAVLLFPRVATASFLVGGAGGAGVLLVRDAATGAWHGPAFYSLDEAGVGAQVGLAQRELIVVLRSCASLQSLYASGARLRVGVSFALEALEHGAGVEVAKDVQVFSRAKGLHVGAALNGAVLRVRPSLAAAYYGRELAPAQILQGDADAEVSRGIRAAVGLATKAPPRP